MPAAITRPPRTGCCSCLARLGLSLGAGYGRRSLGADGRHQLLLCPDKLPLPGGFGRQGLGLLAIFGGDHQRDGRDTQAQDQENDSGSAGAPAHLSTSSVRPQRATTSGSKIRRGTRTS